MHIWNEINSFAGLAREGKLSWSSRNKNASIIEPLKTLGFGDLKA